MSKFLSLPRNYRIYIGHDYPPATRARKPLPYTTVADQREGNKHVKDGTSEDKFVKWRSERGRGLAEPKLINQALQFNIMGGHLPEVAADGQIFCSQDSGPDCPLKSCYRYRWRGEGINRSELFLLIYDELHIASLSRLSFSCFQRPSYSPLEYLMKEEAWNTISILKTGTMVILQTP